MAAISTFGSSLKMGPLVTASHRAVVEGFLAEGMGPEGGPVPVRTAGEVPGGPGFWSAPRVVAPADPAWRMAREEIFGPVVAVIPFDDEEEGIAIANDSDFGLYDYVFSKDGGRAMKVAKQLRAGHVGINTAQRNHEAPFGGFKMSGVGRDGAVLLAASIGQCRLDRFASGQHQVQLGIDQFFGNGIVFEHRMGLDMLRSVTP